jgi:hypothetical protein
MMRLGAFPRPPQPYRRKLAARPVIVLTTGPWAAGLVMRFKHAPGAPVDVEIADASGHVEISIINGPPTNPQSGLEFTGTGRGLTGMRQRVAACGGQLSAGPVAGGWQVLARLPLEPGPGTNQGPGTGCLIRGVVIAIPGLERDFGTPDGLARLRATTVAGPRSLMMADSWRFLGSWPGRCRYAMRPGAPGRR